MVLMNFKGTALHPFPAPICIARRTQLDKGGQTPIPYHAIMCGADGNFLIASYHDLLPAKMEIQRLLKEYGENPDGVFTFMKDPYEEDEK